MKGALRHLHRAVAIAAAFFSPPAQAQQTDVIRRLPFPFGQMITFSSDSDSQAPWHGRAVHRFMNEQLGMPISDSMWVNSASASDQNSALFSSTSTLDARPSGVPPHTVFGLLVREWHRGNIDHFHSWTDDTIVQYKFTLPSPLAFSTDGTAETTVRRGGWMGGFESLGGRQSRGYQQLRLLFDHLPPEDMEIEARFADGSRLVFPPAISRRFRTESNAELQLPATVTVFLNEPPPMGIGASPSVIPASLSSLNLRSASCSSGCASHLIGVERDNFSRWLAATQLPVLELLNIRPALLSSHGGVTYHPSFGGEGPPSRYDFSGLGDADNPTFRDHTRPMASVSGSHAFYADYLRKLGVRSVTSIRLGDQSEINEFWQVPVPPVPRYGYFYAATKTWLDIGEVSDPIERVIDRMAASEPSARDANIDEVTCSTNLFCRNGAQGSTISALLAIGQAMMNAGRKVEHHWYTHFGTARFDPTFKASMESPFPHHAMEQLRKLAMSYYDPSSERPPHLRAWVPPSGVFSNYRIMRHVLPSQVSVDPATSAVAIRSAMDQTLGHLLPDPAAGTRDLHEITIYVPDSSNATASFDGRRLEWFTRNPADETGRQSITLVGDSSPTPVISRIDPAITGRISSSQAKAEWIAQMGGAAVAGAPRQHLRMTALDANPLVTLRPHDLNIWNATHLGLRYRVHRLDGRAPRGEATITFVREDGRRITLAQGQPQKAAPPGADVGWWMSPATGPEWLTETRAQYGLAWRKGAAAQQSLPVLIGKIASVEIRLANAQPGDILDVGDVFAFQSTSNGVAADGLLVVGGQVLDERGSPVPGAAVNIRLPAGETLNLSADNSGYYFSRRAGKGDLIEISAPMSKGGCHPSRGRVIEVQRNEAEIDISFAACQK